MNDESPTLNLTYILKNYEKNIIAELKTLWNGFDIDLSQKEKYEVIGGIFSRQICVTMQFMSSPSIWTDDIAPIILRCLADNYINLAWILENPVERSKLFIIHGLGQEKLANEHRKQQLRNDGQNPEDDELVRDTENWISSQQYSFITEVNFGSWSGISTRKMAEEAGCMDFYNYVYQPFTTTSHNMWNHIAKFNLKLSTNPLHKFLKIPFVPKIEHHIRYLDLAAKYTDKCFQLYYEKFPNSTVRSSSYSIMIKGILELANSDGDKTNSV